MVKQRIKDQFILPLIASLFFVSLVMGQLGSIHVVPNATIYLHDVFLVILILFHTFFVPKKKTLPRLGKWIIWFGLVGVLSLYANAWRVTRIELLQSSLYLIRWIVYAYLYIVVLQSTLSTKFWRWGLILVGTCMSVIGLVQFVVYPDLRNLSYLGWDPYYYRLFSTVLDPNFFGLLSLLMVYIGVSLISVTKRKLVIIACIAINFLAFLLTFSRGSYLAFGVSMLAYVAIMRRWKLLLFSVLAVILFVSIPKPDFEAFHLTRSVSALARLGNWDRAVDLIAQSPVVGFGFNTLRVIGVQRGWLVISDVTKDGIIDSSVLFVWATTGVIGLFVFLGLGYALVRLGLLGMKKASMKHTSAIFVAMLTAAIIHSLFTNSLFYPWIMIVIWISAAVVERGLTVHNERDDL